MLEKRKKVEKEIILSFIALIFLIGGLIAASTSYGRNIREVMELRNRSYVMESTIGIAEKLDDDFTSAKDTIETMAFMYGCYAEVADIDYSYLASIQKNGIFDYVRFVDSSGAVFTAEGQAEDANGKPLNSSDRDFIIDAMKGNSGISYVSASRVTVNPLVLFYAPVYVKDTVFGVLLGAYTEATVNDKMRVSYYSYQADSILVTRDGDIFMIVPSENLDTMMREAGDITSIGQIVDNREVFNETNANLINEAVQDGTEALFVFNGKNCESYGYCVSLESLELSLWHTFPSAAQEYVNNSMNSSRITLQHRVIVLLIVYTVFLVSLWTHRYRKVRKNYLTQRRLARADGLTGSYNTLAYKEELDSIREKIPQSEYSIAAFDINYLKEINDMKGHHAEDEIILATAGLLTNAFSCHGKVFRTGGDEFVVILRCDAEKSEKLMDNFLKLVDDWRGEYSGCLSISSGIVHSRDYEGISPEELASHADEKMYENKRSTHAYRL